MQYELLIIWQTGEKNIYKYSSEQKAQQGEKNMYKVFGNQILFSCINRSSGAAANNL